MEPVIWKAGVQIVAGMIIAAYSAWIGYWSVAMPMAFGGLSTGAVIERILIFAVVTLLGLALAARGVWQLRKRAVQTRPL